MSRIKALEKKLDTLFSECVRQRDVNGRCITCGRPFQGIYTLVTCGHFRKRRHMMTRWNLENAYGQCWRCNGEDNDAKYTTALIERLGEEKVIEIIDLSHEDVHLTYLDLKEIYDALLEYKHKLKS